MGRQEYGGSSGKQENKQWSLIHGPLFLTVFLVISMIQVATSQDKISTLDQGSNIIPSPRYAKTTGKTITQSSRVCNTSKCIEAANQIRISMNLTVDPCDDFYEYACGRWHINNPPIPGDSYYSVEEIVENESNRYKKRKLRMATITINGASKQVELLSSDLYKSCMNVTAIDNLGDAPLRERIRELGGWSMSGNWDEDTWDFNKTLLSMHKMKHVGGPLFVVGFLSGGINKVSYVLRRSLALAKKQYLNLSSKTVSAYRQLIIDVVVLLGGDLSTTAKKADEIIRFEAQLANVSSTRAEWNQRISNKITLEQLQKEVPKFDWIDYFNKLFSSSTILKSEIIAMPSLSYLKNAMKIVDNTTKSVLANYMVWHVIRNEIQWLSVPFRNATLRYKQKTMGTTFVKELWKTCVDSAFESFEDIISAAYVNDHHAQLAGPINMTIKMLHEAIKAFKENVKSLIWLDDATRSKAIEKVDNMGYDVGYPEYMFNSTKIAKLFEKYKGLTIRKDTYYKNKVSLLKKIQQQILKDFKKPRDFALWDFHPLKGFAGYNMFENKITFPAAILQPPMLYPNNFLRAYNLGNFGSIVGHEVMHGFGITRTSRKQDIPVYLCSAFSLAVTSKSAIILKIDAKTTAEENLADNGGLILVLKAYYNWAKQNPSETWRLPGLNFTNEQLFFIGFAQNKCSSSTPERRKKPPSGAYADSKFRVVGPLANFCDFANAFQCKKCSPMNPVNKCYLWSKEGPLAPVVKTNNHLRKFIKGLQSPDMLTWY